MSNNCLFICKLMLEYTLNQRGLNMKKILLNYEELPKSLSKEELSILLQEMKDGSNVAREMIIKHSLRLVTYEMTTKFKLLDMDAEEMFSIGIEGLIKAVNTFKIEKGFDFSTYAITCIDNEILWYYHKIQKAKEMISLDEPVFDRDEKDTKTLKDITLADTNIEEDYEKKETIYYIGILVNQLPDFQKEIIKLYFGFYDDKLYSQSEIATLLKISQASVSRNLKSTLKALRSTIESVNLIDLGIPRDISLSKQK